MEILCTRPGCTRPQNHFADLDDPNTLKTTQQKYCTSCGMPLILGGRYLPSKLLGQGGFGAAYLAKDRYTTSLRQCVVKLFQPSGDLSPQAMQTAQELFQREAEVLEKLGNEHKQIPNSYAFFPLVVPRQGSSQEQFFYLVQEFIDGEDLEQELERRGKFSQAEVLEVLAEILKVLQFIHENGSIHRDIKPSNIMRSRKGRLYLLDFGAVKQVTTGSAKPGRSTGIYSMGFAPPEQMQGSQVFPSTDLYALAVTCLTLLTGKDASELYDSYENKWKWRNYTPKINSHLAEIFDKMLHPSPSQRFQSAQEILDIFTGKSNPPRQASSSQPAPAPATPQSQPQPPVSTPQPASPPPQAQSQQPQSQPQPQQKSAPPARRQPHFTLTEILANAAFIGFEGALVFIVLGSLLPSPSLSIGLFGAIMAGLLYALYRRLLGGSDIPIFAAVSFVIVIVVPFFRDMGRLDVVIFAILAAAGVVAVTAFFQLVYKLIARLF